MQGPTSSPRFRQYVAVPIETMDARVRESSAFIHCRMDSFDQASPRSDLRSMRTPRPAARGLRPSAFGFPNH